MGHQRKLHEEHDSIDIRALILEINNLAERLQTDQAKLSALVTAVHTATIEVDEDTNVIVAGADLTVALDNLCHVIMEMFQEEDGERVDPVELAMAVRLLGEQTAVGHFDQDFFWRIRSAN